LRGGRVAFGRVIDSARARALGATGGAPRGGRAPARSAPPPAPGLARDPPVDSPDWFLYSPRLARDRLSDRAFRLSVEQGRFRAVPGSTGGQNAGNNCKEAGRRRLQGRRQSRVEHEDRTMFAVIKTGGKQYKVAAQDVITIEKLPVEAGSAVAFDEVLMVGVEGAMKIGSPVVVGAKVEGEIVEQTRGPKTISFHKRRRKNSKRKRGHRQDLTVVRITGIHAG
jgi:large subunit ribosomal protein L21